MKMSDAQFRVLDNLAHGREPFCHIKGAAAHGGATGTRVALRQRGWITAAVKLTLAGLRAHAAVNRLPWVPMCWKCASRIIGRVVDAPGLQFVGCKDRRSIKSYEDARKRCPLMPEKCNVEPQDNR